VAGKEILDKRWQVARLAPFVPVAARGRQGPQGTRGGLAAMRFAVPFFAKISGQNEASLRGGRAQIQPSRTLLANGSAAAKCGSIFRAENPVAGASGHVIKRSVIVRLFVPVSTAAVPLAPRPNRPSTNH